MARLQWSAPYNGEIETLKLLKDPLHYGLGHYKDVDGITWDIMGVFGGGCSESGKSFIQAREVCGQSYYGTASWDNSYGFHEWIPYYFEVINE